MRGELSGCSEDVKEMVLLLLSYFDKKEDAMFCYVEDTCLAGEDNPAILPRRFMLNVDQNIVHHNIASFVSALCMMFGSYYRFNIHYSSELASTLEFLQRQREECPRSPLQRASLPTHCANPDDIITMHHSPDQDRSYCDCLCR
eukprot:superscaffoldBa00001843_g12234